MKNIILAVVFLVGIRGFSQKEQIIEEYSIPIFTVTSLVNGPRLYHLAFNYGVIASTFDSLQAIPGVLGSFQNYEMVFEKVRLFKENGIVDKTLFRFKEAIPCIYPIIIECEYRVPCYTRDNRDGTIQPYVVLGQLAHDSEVRWSIYNYLFSLRLEPNMRYLFKIRESYSETGQRSFEISYEKENYIRTTRITTAGQ